MMLPLAPHCPTDLTPLCERLAGRLRSQGARHPEAAAVSLAVRGTWGVDRHVFAPWLGLSPDELATIEDGARPWHELPTPLVAAARANVAIDLHQLGLE